MKKLMYSEKLVFISWYILVIRESCLANLDNNVLLTRFLGVRSSYHRE